MKLNRQFLRKLILEEINALNEGFSPGEIIAQGGKIIFNNITYTVQTRGFELPVKFLKVLENGFLSVGVKTPYVPLMSDGSVKKGEITQNLDTLKSLLSKGKQFKFTMKDEKGEDVNLDFVVEK